MTDTITGLQWQDDDAAITTDGNWTATIDYCENTLALGGYSDWRLPNRSELLFIVDYNSQDDSSVYSVFANRSSNYYWSSTAYSCSTANAWIVRFTSTGDNVDHSSKANDRYVRCVRGGQVDHSASLPPVIMYLLD